MQAVGSFKGDIDVGIDVDVDMVYRYRYLAVSTNWGLTSRVVMLGPLILGNSHLC